MDKKKIVSSFKQNSFEPSSYWHSNNHWQTIVGSGAITGKICGFQDRPFDTTFERINTLDGDYFDVEFSNNVEYCDSIVLVLHGLESNRKSHTVTKYATALLEKGFSVCLISFRACNGEENITKRSYHLGFTEDMHYLTDLVHKRYPDKKIYLCGFSLGGNVILKMLGELGEEAINRNIAGAAVSCVPFDPVASQGKLDVGFSRIAYSLTFLETLKQKAEVHNAKYPGIFDIQAVRECKTLGDFDNLFIAKVYGFKDKVDYYRQSGSKWWLPKIKVPTIAINAKDDPFIEEKSLPTEKDVGDAPVRLIYHDKGGHCGFYTTLSGSADKGADPTVKPYGWLAEELSRAIHHIHVTTEQHHSQDTADTETKVKIAERQTALAHAKLALHSQQGGVNTNTEHSANRAMLLGTLAGVIALCHFIAPSN